MNDNSHTKLGLHSVRNMIGEPSQLSLFGERTQQFAEDFGIQLEGTVERSGIDLTEVQGRIMEGILHGFSLTAYKGNLTSCTIDEIKDEKFSGALPTTYKYVQEIPRLRATQTEILDWSGINKGSIASWARGVEAINELGRKQYCFFYDRLALDEHGQPIKSSQGRWKKEEVFAVDTLFTIKEVRDSSDGDLKYYEITPSAIFLDQRETYFMLVPYNWREEVKNLYGSKKASSYTFRFLLFLRYQYELKRRAKNQKPPYQVRMSPEEIFIAMRMPESVYKRQKKRAEEILQDAYSISQKLGYLTSFERVGIHDVLTLNDDKYFCSKDIAINKAISKMNAQKEEEFSPDTIQLRKLFYSARASIDSAIQPPSGKQMSMEMECFSKLIKARATEEIESLILWSVSQPYWCSRLSTPAKLLKNFSEAWSELCVFNKKSAKIGPESNMKIAREIAAAIKNQSQYQIEILNKHVEIGNGVHQPFCLEYIEKNFKERFLSELERRGLVPTRD